MIKSKNFKEIEFVQCTPSCSMQNMDQEFINMLDNARDIANTPFVINCAYRSKEHDLSKGRSGNGDHPQGKGVDIKCNTSSTRYLIISALLKAGFNRIGIAKTFIHAGSGKNLQQNVIFDYYE